MNAPALALPSLPMRKGDMLLPTLIDEYMLRYSGRDSALAQRLGFWKLQLAAVALQDLSDDHVHQGLQVLEQQTSRYFAGKDAAGAPIYKAKKKPLAPATLNRYWAALSSVITWSIRQRIAPKGYANPCHAVQRRPEDNAKTRFLTDDERARLLDACRAAAWPRMYMLVLMALTTGARKSELLRLRWQDVDLARGVALVHRSKNGDSKTLPLTPAVIEQLQAFAGARGALVFPSARAPGQPFSFESKQWPTVLKTAKLKNCRFHDLRHSCASTLAANGATLLEIADQLGHRQLQVTKRYAHLATGHKAALIERVFGEVR